MATVKDYNTAIADQDVRIWVPGQLADANILNLNQEFQFTQVKNLEANTLAQDSAILQVIADNKVLSEASDTTIAGSVSALQTATNLSVQQLQNTDTTLAGVLNSLTNSLSNVDNTSDSVKNVLSAAKLTTERTINGVAFDGSANITINAVDSTSRLASSLLGVANGVATLDATGLIPTSQLPAYVDDVLEYATLATFPATGIAGKIYVDLATNKTYRWSGTVYIYITSGAVDSVAGKTGVVTLVKADVGLSNVDNTTDLLKPISTATQTALNGKVDDAQVLTNVPAGALFTDTVYTLPVASTTVLGGVKAGTNIAIDANGVISANDTSVAFTEITGKPTTLSGYGITDAVTSTQLSTLQTQVNAIDSNAINTTLITANATLVAASENIVTTNALTLTLPASPVTGMKVEILDGTSSNTSTTLSGNGANIEGATTYVINTPGFAVKAVYVNATYGWRIFGF